MKVNEFTTCVINDHAEPMKMLEEDKKLIGICNCRKPKRNKYFGKRVYKTDLVKSKPVDKNQGEEHGRN